MPLLPGFLLADLALGSFGFPRDSKKPTVRLLLGGTWRCKTNAAVRKIAYRNFLPKVNALLRNRDGGSGALLCFLSPRGQPRRTDHPFVFLIRDNQTTSILFMGRVTKPKE